MGDSSEFPVIAVGRPDAVSCNVGECTLPAHAQIDLRGFNFRVCYQHKVQLTEALKRFK